MTGVIEQLVSGDAEPGTLGRAIAAARNALARRRAPAPGRGVMPAAVTVRGAVSSRPETIVVPLRVRGRAGSRSINAIVLDQRLEIPAPPNAAIELTVEPVLPAMSSLAGLTTGTPQARARALETLQLVLWQSARATGEGYLGLPVDGPIKAKYLYGAAKVRAVEQTKPLPRERPRPIPIALASLLFAGMVFAGWRWWLAN